MVMQNVPRQEKARGETRNEEEQKGPGIDSKELIPPAYVARRAGTTTLFLLGSFLPPIDCSKIPELCCAVLR